MAQDLKEGLTAPGFSLPDEGGGTVSLQDYTGSQNVVLYFYPKDDTPGCTAEGIAFSEKKPDFDALDTVIFGVSADSAGKHVKFKDKHGLTIRLLADEDKKAIKAYGVWVEKSMYGRKYMGIERTTFVIGKNGKIARIWRKVKVKNHAEAVLQAVRALARG